jgi:predicted nucleotidyltransferase
MDGRPFLVRVAALLREHKLEAILIGNAAAALQGAPVTTVDFDFYLRKNPASVRKLKRLADALGATILRPFYPASDLFRLSREDGLQLDFMGTIHGARSFEGIRSRARTVDFDGEPLLVASLADIIKSKRAAGRPSDLAALPVLEKTLHEETVHPQRKAGRSQERE